MDAAEGETGFLKIHIIALSPSRTLHPCLLNQIQYSSLVLAFCFAARSLQCSHDGAALGLVLAEGGGEELCLVGQMEESLRETADRAGFIGRLKFVHAGQSCATENTVYALL